MLSLRVDIVQRTTFAERYKYTLLTASVNPTLSLTSSFQIPNLNTMCFSFLATLSSLVALAAVNAFPAENLQRDVTSKEGDDCSGKSAFSGQKAKQLDYHNR